MKHDHPDKIIFLDIDGVINTTRRRYIVFDKEAMSNLEEILDSTGAKIVVSSSWRREGEEMFKNFLEHGCTQKIIDAIIDITVRGYNFTIKGSTLPIVRGNEIKEWVDRHLKYPWHADPSCDEHYRLTNPDGTFRMMNSNKRGVDYSYLILDDDTDMLYDQKDNFINTDSNVGITKENVIQAIKILNYKKMEPIIKFNGGNGAILCNRCSVIIKSGLTQKEFAGETDLLLCEKCKALKNNFSRQEVIDLLHKALGDIGYGINIQTYPDGTVSSYDIDNEWITRNLK